MSGSIKKGFVGERFKATDAESQVGLSKEVNDEVFLKDHKMLTHS